MVITCSFQLKSVWLYFSHLAHTRCTFSRGEKCELFCNEFISNDCKNSCTNTELQHLHFTSLTSLFYCKIELEEWCKAILAISFYCNQTTCYCIVYEVMSLALKGNLHIIKHPGCFLHSENKVVEEQKKKPPVMFHLDTVVAGVYTHFFHWNSWFISHWGRCKPEFFSPCDVNVSQKTFALIYLTSLPRQPVFSRAIGLRINKYLAFLPHLSVDKCNVDLQIHVYAALQRVRAALDGHDLHPRGCGMAWA